MITAGATLAGKRTLHPRRLATLARAALVAFTVACVPPLPGSPYDAPDDMVGAAGGAGEARGGAGGSSVPTGSGGVVGPTGSAGTTGGPGGAPAAACQGAPLTTGRIFDGIPLSPVYTFAGTGLMPPTVTPITGSLQAYQVTAAPGATTDPSQAFSGFGFNFGEPSCLDANPFSGVSFTVLGDLGTCTLRFSLVTSEDTSIAYNPLGACTAEPCYPPMSPPVSLGASTVGFADLSGGMPMPMIDARSLIGIQWTLVPPTDAATPLCVANFTISNVSFVP